VNQNIGLRLAVDSQAVEIATMSRDLVEVGLGWSWTPAKVSRSIRCPDSAVLTAPDAGRIAGFAIMFLGEEQAHLNLLAVSPTHRFAGLGRRLVQWLEKSAVVAGISVVYLEVRATNTGAQAFYKRLGYREIGHVPGYYRGCESAIRMARDLWEPRSTDAG
jgi:ribosomal-protein-alanine N-acetyltransferase